MLTNYIEQAMTRAEYNAIEARSFSGRVPECKGVIAFGETLRECKIALRTTLEDWLLIGLKLGHELPTLDVVGREN